MAKIGRPVKMTPEKIKLLGNLCRMKPTLEKFKVIKNFPNHRISSNGRIQTRQRRGTKVLGEWRDMKLSVTRGYLFFVIRSKGQSKICTIHRTVAKYFIKNPRKKEQVNHKDGNKLNNNVENLEWVTPKENVRHAFCMGLIKRKGSNNSQAKVDEATVLAIRTLANEGYTNAQLAHAYNLKNNTISTIKYGHTWKHVCGALTLKTK